MNFCRLDQFAEKLNLRFFSTKKFRLDSSWYNVEI